LKKHFIGLMLTVFALAAGLVMPVQAQSGTVLALSPEESSLPLGNEVLLELTVKAGMLVNAFDLTLSYDPAVLALESWSHGDYLSNVWVVKKVEEPGLLRIAATQLARPAVSGDGVLLELTFSSTALGESRIEIVEAVLADTHGNKIAPETEAGLVLVIQAPTFTHTPTPTQTPTTKPTLAPTATRTSTSSEGSYPVDTEAPKSGATVTATPTRTGTASSSEAGVSGRGQDSSTMTPEAKVDENGEDPSGQGAGSSSSSEQTPGGEASLTVEAVIAGEAEDSDGMASGFSEGGSSEVLFSSSRGLEFLLWVLLAGSLIVLIVMIVILIQRSTHQPEDLLL